MGDSIIEVESLAKEYRLGVISHQTLTKDLQSWWARVRGKEDPNAPLVSQQGDNASSGRFWALKDVTFQVRQGDVVGVIGRNGAGKSTLLKILSRVTSPSRGEVRLRGRVASLLEVGTGFHPELTGRENIFLNGAILGMDKNEIRRKFDEIVDFSEIGRFIDTPVKRYSSGMYVRLAFAVAAHLEPEILVVDEVLAVGDAPFQKKCLGKMGEVAGQGRTVLFVSHNMQAIKNLCDRGILIDKGRIAYDGTADEVVGAYLSQVKHSAFNSNITPDMHTTVRPGLEIIRLELLDRNGERISSLLMDETFCLRIFFRIHNPEQGYRVGIVFSTMDHTKIATIISTQEGRSHIYGDENRIYAVSVQLNNVFMAGSYNVSLHVKSALGEAVDVVDGFTLTVDPVSTGRGDNRGAGVVWVPSAWTEVTEAGV